MKTSVFRAQYRKRFCDRLDRSQNSTVDNFVNILFSALIIVNLSILQIDFNEIIQGVKKVLLLNFYPW